MTVQHQRDGRIAVVTAEGRYAVAELRDAFAAALAAELADGLLFDVSRSQSLGDRSAHDVRAMAHFVASHGERFSQRFAIVATSDASYGLMRLGSVVTESQGVTTHVFRDLNAAMAWLRAGPG